MTIASFYARCPACRRLYAVRTPNVRIRCSCTMQPSLQAAATWEEAGPYVDLPDPTDAVIVTERIEGNGGKAT